MLEIKSESLTLSVDLSGSTLTRKEKEVIGLLLAGYDVMTIGRLKHRSVKTVSAQKMSAYRKLGVRGDITLFPALIKGWGMQVLCETEKVLPGINYINISASQAN